MSYQVISGVTPGFFFCPGPVDCLSLMRSQGTWDTLERLVSIDFPLHQLTLVKNEDFSFLSDYQEQMVRRLIKAQVELLDAVGVVLLFRCDYQELEKFMDSLTNYQDIVYLAYVSIMRNYKLSDQSASEYL